jgi:uncharacterized membrane protein
MLPNALFVLNLLSTWYMVGLIWMVQIVHYQMFDRVGADVFQRYALDHSRLITPIVAIPMLIEIATAFGLLIVSPAGMPRTWLMIGVVLVLVIWASTVLLQVPCHERLASGFDREIYARLVTSNWIRTIAWSARGGLMGYLLWRLM